MRLHCVYLQATACIRQCDRSARTIRSILLKLECLPRGLRSVVADRLPGHRTKGPRKVSVPIRGRTLVGRNGAFVELTIQDRRADRARAATAARTLAHLSGVRGRAPSQHRRKLGGTKLGREAGGRSISSQTYSPPRIFLARATRSRSASLSASERASFRPAEVMR